ncbi:MAG: RNA polymerase sigma factor RpoD/SigA [Pedobacter sp.]|nr:MAG: RNA polymerase sigma factor RpoD/SigA [Pedobacter sp.]
MRELKILKSHTNRNEESLHRYLSDISRINLIDPTEEIQLARKIRSGDKAAEHKLITANLRFVISCAKKYQNLGLSLADLVCEGNLGLIKAAGIFDETRGFKFISYAVWWVRQSIITAINDYARIIRLPMNQQLGMTAINNHAIKLEQSLQRAPTLQELSEVIGKTENQLADHIRANARARYLEDQIPGGESEDNTLIHFLPDESGNHASEWISAEHRHERIYMLLSTLKTREREILIHAYGLFGNQQLENEDIAIKMGLSKERIRQLLIRSIHKLQNVPQSSMLREYA